MSNEKKKRPLYMKKTIILAILAGYIALLVLLLVTSWLQITEYQESLKEKNMNALVEYTDKTAEVMSNIDRHIYDISAYNSNFQMLSQVGTETENYKNSYELKETMRNKLLIEEGLHGCFIYYDMLSKSWYTVDTNFIEPTMTAELNKKLKLRAQQADSRRTWEVMMNGEDTVLAIMFRKDNVAICGIHGLGNVEEAIQDRVGEDVNIVLINGGSTITGSELEAELGIRSEIKDAADVHHGRLKDKYIYSSRIKKTDLWVTMVAEYNFFSVMGIQQLMLLIVTGMSVVAVILLYRFLRRDFLVPLKELTGVMNKIAEGEMSSVPDLDLRFAELNQVNKTLDHMITEIEKQKLLVYEEIIDKQKAQMQYLQLQLKPHFYLNSLKTLNNMASRGVTDKMQELIYALSDHMRYILNSERETVPLSAEIKFVENYVELQRYSGRNIQLNLDVAKEVAEWYVPVLCVQTFIENSIKYAKLGSDGMTLVVGVRCQLLSAEGKRFLDLEISDNGQGYSAEVLNDINSSEVSESTSIGVNNIKRRCKLLYGDNAEFQFFNHNGAVSELFIPEEKI